MRKISKKLLAVLLAAAMVLTLGVHTVVAEGPCSFCNTGDAGDCTPTLTVWNIANYDGTPESGTPGSNVPPEGTPIPGVVWEAREITVAQHVVFDWIMENLRGGVNTPADITSDEIIEAVEANPSWLGAAIRSDASNASGASLFTTNPLSEGWWFLTVDESTIPGGWTLDDNSGPDETAPYGSWAPFVVSLPMYYDGEWICNVNAFPKFDPTTFDADKEIVGTGYLPNGGTCDCCDTPATYAGLPFIDWRINIDTIEGIGGLAAIPDLTPATFIRVTDTLDPRLTLLLEDGDIEVTVNGTNITSLVVLTASNAALLQVDFPQAALDAIQDVLDARPCTCPPCDHTGDCGYDNGGCTWVCTATYPLPDIVISFRTTVRADNENDVACVDCCDCECDPTDDDEYCICCINVTAGDGCAWWICCENEANCNPLGLGDIDNQAVVTFSNFGNIITNRPGTTIFGVRILKVDSEGNPLEGAVFHLYRIVGGSPAIPYECTCGEPCLGGECGECVDCCEDEDTPAVPGTHELVRVFVLGADDFYLYYYGLFAGEYLLVETVAPPGFIVPSEGFELAINLGSAGACDCSDEDCEGENDCDNWLTYVVERGEIVNHTVDWTLPDTGGDGARIFLIVGSAILAGAALFLVIYFLKNKKEQEQG